MLAVRSVALCLGTVVTLSTLETSSAFPDRNRLIKPHFDQLEDKTAFVSTNDPVNAVDVTSRFKF